MTKFDELKEKYPNLIPVPELRANVSIIELATQYGYELKPEKGQSRPVLQHPSHGDTIIIKSPHDASQQVYQRAGDFSDSGTIIDFIRNRLSTVFSMFNRPGQHEFKSITDVLYDYLKIDPNQIARNRKTFDFKPDPVQKQSFAKDLFDIRPLEADNYLLKRNIDPSIVNSLEFSGKALTQVSYLNPATGHVEDFLTVKANPDRKYIEFHNVAFPYYNGLTADVMGFELRNENLKQHAPGSDRYRSVFLSNVPQKAQYFLVAESVIDAMAHKQLRAIRGDNAFDTVYFSTGGQLTHEQINTITRYSLGLNKDDDWKIVLAFDNDPKGHLFDLQFVQQVIAPHFPVSSTVATGGRIGLALPSDDLSRPAVDALLKRMETFNSTVRTQIPSVEGDDISKKELSSQLINIAATSNKQISLHVPETTAALAYISKSLLDVSGLSKRILVNKACSKDFCEDLTRHIERGQKYAYTITDDTGRTLLNSNSAVSILKTLAQLQHYNTGDGQNMTFQASLRLSSGWLKEMARLEIIKGEVVKAMQSPEFKRKVQEEKGMQAEQLTSKRQEATPRPENNPEQEKSTQLKIRP